MLLSLAACGPLPRDPDGTVERVTRDRAFAVGQVAGAQSSGSTALLATLSREIKAKPTIRTGKLEPLLLGLERGDIDLVIGARLDPKSPWAKRVTLTAPLDAIAADGTQEFAAMRNGENAWIIRVDRVAKRVSVAR